MCEKDKIKEKFILAANTIKKLKVRPTDNELLTLYAHYKQSTEGNCNIAKPGMFDITSSAKWNAWNNLQGTDKYHAMKIYINCVMKLIDKYTQF